MVEFFNSLSGQTIYAMLGVALLDFLLGIAAAVRDGTFSLDEVAAVLRSHIVGRVFPIALMLVFGYLFNQDLILTAGYASAALYTAETAGSIIASWGPQGKTILGVTRAAVQPVPQD